MNWIDEIDHIRNEVSNHRMLLSTALMATARAIGRVASQDVIVWLNREVVGYTLEDYEHLVKIGEARVFMARNVFGRWGVSAPNGAFIEKGSTSAVLTDGIQQIEVALNSLFDISVLEAGQPDLIDRTVRQSDCAKSTYLVPYMNATGAKIAVTGADLVKLYFSVCANLCTMIDSLKKYLAGEYLLVK